MTYNLLDLTYENEQLRSKIQALQDKLEKVCNQWKKHAGCVPGADWRSEGVGEWEGGQDGTVGDAPSGRDTACGVLLVVVKFCR